MARFKALGRALLDAHVLFDVVPDDIAATAALNELTAEIDRRIPALLLVREAGLVEKLILALEEAHSEGRLRDDEHLLLSRLREVFAKPPSEAVLVAADLEPLHPRALPDRRNDA